MASPDILWEEVGQHDMTFIAHNLKDHNIQCELAEHQSEGKRNGLLDNFQGKTVVTKKNGCNTNLPTSSPLCQTKLISV